MLCSVTHPISSPTWNAALQFIADQTLVKWTRDQRSITSLDLKLHMRSIVGPGTQVLQTDVSKYLQAAMKTSGFAWTDLYISRELPVPLKQNATYLEYYVADDKKISPLRSFFRKAKEAFV